LCCSVTASNHLRLFVSERFSTGLDGVSNAISLRPDIAVHHQYNKGEEIMRRRETTKARRLATKATIASVIAAVLAYAAYRAHRNEKLSVDAIKSTLKGSVKDIKIPEPVSAADVNKLLVSRGQKIAKAIDKEKEAVAKILENTADKITKVQNNHRK
jgi:hypothetical protein